MSETKQATYPVATIAKLLLLSERRVYQLVTDGVIPRHDRGRFEIAAAVQGYIRFLQERQVGGNGQLTDYNTEKARLTKLQADFKEIELAELKGKLIPMELVLEAWMGHVSNARAKLLAMPQKAAAQVVGVDSYVEIDQLLTVLVHESLDELSNDGLPQDYRQRIKTITKDLEISTNADS
jgi:phage terminase Nu1 subunit (DNA packaging protein)